MSDTSDSFDQQIAALEAALQLPLPATSRAQIEQELRARRAAQGAAIQGTTEVSGTLYGNAIGVNLGTAQTFFDAQPPTAAGDQPTAHVSQEAIDDQRELLAAHRRTLAVYLKQQAMLSTAFAPPGVANGIHEAREGIRRAKASLRAWGVDVTDLPDD